jgi:hypothetical protein
VSGAVESRTATSSAFDLPKERSAGNCAPAIRDGEWSAWKVYKESFGQLRGRLPVCREQHARSVESHRPGLFRSIKDQD